MTDSEKALQAYIDSRIKPELQEHYAEALRMLRFGWLAGVEFMEQQNKSKSEQRMDEIMAENKRFTEMMKPAPVEGVPSL